MPGLCVFQPESGNTRTLQRGAKAKAWDTTGYGIKDKRCRPDSLQLLATITGGGRGDREQGRVQGAIDIACSSDCWACAMPAGSFGALQHTVFWHPPSELCVYGPLSGPDSRPWGGWWEYDERGGGGGKTGICLRLSSSQCWSL